MAGGEGWLVANRAFEEAAQEGGALGGVARAGAGFGEEGGEEGDAGLAARRVPVSRAPAATRSTAPPPV
ncbi:hypothetical protein O1L60_02050 [Streptomyces diastatochromogenes]|nr:hypothetical protein [Streptomyces diastatochromogenes]